MERSKTDRLKTIFFQLGLHLDDDEYDEELYMDSIQFISLIVAIEREFSIKIDEEHFADDTLKSFNDFLNLLG